MQHPTQYRTCHKSSTTCLGTDLHLTEGNSDLSDYLAFPVSQTGVQRTNTGLGSEIGSRNSCSWHLGDNVLNLQSNW
jgi:hypothetical protein